MTLMIIFMTTHTFNVPLVLCKHYGVLLLFVLIVVYVDSLWTGDKAQYITM